MLARFLHGSHLGKRRGFNQRMLVWLREPKLGLRKVYGPGRQFLGCKQQVATNGWRWGWAYPPRNPRGGASVCDG